MKRSVVLDVPDWPGWNKFLTYYDEAKLAPFPEDSRLAFVTLFETGCRVSEAILLKPEMFKWNEEALVGYRIPVLKRRRRWTRDVIIKIDELNPLAQDFIKVLEDCESEYLLPARSRFSRSMDPFNHTTRQTLYNRITEINPDLFPHGLRGLRASMLHHERDFTVQDLVSWFSWKNADMAIHYTRTKNLASSMGIEKLPL